MSKSWWNYPLKSKDHNYYLTYYKLGLQLYILYLELHYKIKLWGLTDLGIYSEGRVK